MRSCFLDFGGLLDDLKIPVVTNNASVGKNSPQKGSISPTT